MSSGLPLDDLTDAVVSASASLGGSCLLRSEEVACCPACEGAEISERMVFRDHLHGIPGPFRYARCASCKTVYQNPRVVAEDLGLCYPGDYYTHELPTRNMAATLPPPGSWRDRMRRAVLHATDGKSASDLSALMRALGHVLALAPGVRRRARYGLPDDLATRGDRHQRCLEVGPGQGFTLAQLRWLGWEAIGLDIDPLAAETARELSRCEVRVGSLVSVDFPEQHFDLIYMNHVLEHLPDLQPSLGRTYELLRAGGRLVLVYPNPDSLGGQWLGEYSPIWDPPRHLVLPSLTGIRTILRQIGFQPVHTRTSARGAALIRGVARGYRAGRRQTRGFDAQLDGSDRAFAAIENTLVALGMGVGEEIIVTAWK
jgi:SAM-dependent methyltransferase